jgi:FkbM family methyltransferase
MSLRIFLDVGANTGQSLAAALDPVFRFDQIVCFEPVESCWWYLGKFKDDRIRVEHFGLWNKPCARFIYEPGIKGASMWRKDKARTDATELCEFRRATDWFKENIKAGDTVFLKLNCEGAECDILDDLLDSGEFDKVSFCMIDFDVRKIASQKHRQFEILERLLLNDIKFPRVAFSKQVMRGATHQERIKNWLRMVEA